MYINYGFWIAVCVLYQHVADMKKLGTGFKGQISRSIRQREAYVLQSVLKLRHLFLNRLDSMHINEIVISEYPSKWVYSETVFGERTVKSSV
jgi:hypothetical protein